MTETCTGSRDQSRGFSDHVYRETPDETHGETHGAAHGETHDETHRETHSATHEETHLSYVQVVYRHERTLVIDSSCSIQTSYFIIGTACVATQTLPHTLYCPCQELALSQPSANNISYYLSTDTLEYPWVVTAKQ